MVEVSQSSRSDRERLEQLPQRFAEAWNRHDAVALGELFARDADFVNVLGMVWRGRPQIVDMHARLFATIFARSELAFEAVDVKPLGSDAAAVRAAWTMRGHAQANASWEAERRGILLLIAVRAGDAWTLATAQNTDTVATPPGMPL